MYNKVFKVTIQTLVLAYESESKWTVDPSQWGHHALIEYLLDNPELHISTTSEVATFASEQPKAEAPPTTVVPLFNAAPPAKTAREEVCYPNLGKRMQRMRFGSVRHGFDELEYRYRSAEYIKLATDYGVGTLEGDFIWLSSSEATKVGTELKRLRAERAAQRAAKRAEGGAK